jgi:hypothetical protein
VVPKDDEVLDMQAGYRMRRSASITCQVIDFARRRAQSTTPACA